MLLFTLLTLSIPPARYLAHFGGDSLFPAAFLRAQILPFASAIIINERVEAAALLGEGRVLPTRKNRRAARIWFGSGTSSTGPRVQESSCSQSPCLLESTQG